MKEKTCDHKPYCVQYDCPVKGPMLWTGCTKCGIELADAPVRRSKKKK